MSNVPNDQGGTDHVDDADLIADGAPLDTVPGGYLMSSDDLAAAVGNYKTVFSGDWDDSGAPSREELVRIRTLKGYHDDPDTMWRRHVIADQGMIDRLACLASASPNMARAIEIVRRAAILSKHGKVPLQVPPVVLVGPPGVGKTRYATSLAAALGVSSTLITGSTITDVGKIIGYHPSWKGAGPGLVAKSLLGCTTTSPVIVIDEAEKISAVDGLPFPLDALLAALEPSTARNYRDGYLDVPMNAGGVIWMLCVNDLAGVSAPLLDRCIVVQVSALSGVERDRALADMAADVALDHNIAPFPLAAADLAVLAAVPLRRARTVMAAALAAAIDDGRDWPTPADYRTALDIVGGATPARSRPAGFVRFAE